MNKATYYNRYESINRVVSAVGQLGNATATDVSKIVNLSRQNILDVLKHAETWGYVTHVEEPYRYYKNGQVMVTRKVWKQTHYGYVQSKWYVDAMKKYQSGKGMKPLL